ncbi:MAG: HAMP domain-containing protein [Candidatus Electrothrix aestuarii]|uniref:HAMP domain-containing protein n=1 Tax=Candidatus Electrothrix aestuarii TaxID=3062594 RepID=A0AAU8LX48_9BACT|nr:HAMP domain-containing protein [Candidatus Electrothrix aestuarii]
MSRVLEKLIPKHFFFVKTIIFFILFAIISLHLATVIPTLNSLIKEYQQAKRVFFLNDVSDDLYTAVGNYGFERGRVNVVLKDAGPVERMDMNRQFILDRRAEGDKALQSALSKLADVQRADIKNALTTITQLTSKIEELREETAKDLVISKDKRKQDLAETWFAAMTAYIESIESLLVGISSDISDADGMISRYSSLKHTALSLRNTAGPEVSILSATMLSQAPLRPQLIVKIQDLQIRTEERFRNLSHLSQPLADPEIPNALITLKTSYYDEYLPYSKTTFQQAIYGGPYTYTPPQFLSHGVEFLLQISIFMDCIVTVTKNYAQSKLSESRWQIFYHLFSTSVSLILIFLIFIFAHYRIIQPITQVTEATLRLAQKNLDTQVPQQHMQNEIGKLARAVAVFKEMALQQKEDVAALEKASVERELLVSELRESLAEIKVLRGILPICSFCKKIRNDDGYYEQLESYIYKHSGVDFSHTICPSCMRKHYPEEHEFLCKKKQDQQDSSLG